MISKTILATVLATGLSAVWAALAACAGAATPDVFNMGPGQTSLEFVTVGNPGNAAKSVRLAWASTPAEAPVGVSEHIVDVSAVPASAVILSQVPTSSWTYGCGATSAGMIFGYYDRIGFSNMYGGPSNGGIAAFADLGNQCSIVATKQGFDGRTTRGHVDDYYVSYKYAGPDPWEENWAEHAWAGCVADFVGTSQWKWDYNKDGVRDHCIDASTAIWLPVRTIFGVSPLIDYVAPPSCGLPQTDLCHGMRLFAESRGYTVVSNYTETMDFMDPVYRSGFSFNDYVAEIDAGRPVAIYAYSSTAGMGHMMVGVGYDAATTTVYLHDTWGDYLGQVAWGGSYAGYALEAVAVIQIVPEPATLSLLLALGGLLAMRRRRNR